MADLIKGVLLSQPAVQMKKSPHFYRNYDGFYLLLCSALLLGFYFSGFRPLLGGPTWAWLPVGALLFAGLVWAHLLIHNCTHGSLPRPINRLVGELLGLCVVVRYASWDVVHMRHHKYSDDRVQDPHPNFSSFWRTVLHTVVNVESQLMQQYYDIWGDTPENRALERRRAWVSYGTNVVLIAVWLWVLGPWFALLVFTPANALAGLFVVHFNWSTHNGMKGQSETDFRPVNLDHGYFWLGNRLFAGIYMHANHHTRPHLFNPMRWPALYGPQEALVDGPTAGAAPPTAVGSR